VCEISETSLNRLSAALLRIPLMVIADSGPMVIRSERSDAGVFIISEVIGMSQG